MKILDRKAFLEMPTGTIAAKFGDTTGEGFYFGPVFVKWDTFGNDFAYQDLEGQFEGWTGSESNFEELDRMLADPTHESPPLDYDSSGRDGLFDEDQKFAVWSRQDALNLIALFQSALEIGYPVTSPRKVS